jgi:6-phosphogluconolactonase
MKHSNHFFNIDSRRRLFIPGGHEATIHFMAEHFVSCAKEAILQRGHFFVALSGGSTPKAIYHELALHFIDAIDWEKVSIFFSDERAVDPQDKESNYFSAMQSGIESLGIPIEQIHRMVAEKDLIEESIAYETIIKKKVPHATFDLIMLGMGDDGHTASLFPNTEAVKVQNRLVVANHVPIKKTDRMTFTVPLINQARLSCFYVLGSSKKEMVKICLTKNFQNEEYPCTLIGSEKNPALWILDQSAAESLE